MDEADWTKHLKRVEEQIEQLDQIPQLGPLPPFPYEALIEALGRELSLTLTIREEWCRWESKEGALEGFGAPLTHLYLNCPPFEGALIFSLSVEGLQAIMHATLGGDPHAAALYDSDLREGFLDFLAAAVLKSCHETGYPLTPQVAAKQPFPEGPFLTKHLIIEGLSTPQHCRLLLTPPLCQSIRTQYEEAKVPLSGAFAEGLEVKLSAKIGSTELSGEEWRTLKVGDFVTLDHCTTSLEKGEGSALLTCEESPLFEGEIGPEGITIKGIAS